jgi:glycosyltransferase involved in cell wall biosynthesis
MPKYSVVVPVHNEELNLYELTNRLIAVMSQVGDTFEILIIDDGSEDNTWKTLLAISNVNKKVKAIRLSRNFGQHHAITAGLNACKGDWVVVMDGDLQDRPEVIPQLINETNKGFDVVFVNRINRPEKMYYRILQRIFYFTLKYLSGIKFNHSQANFSIINRKVVNYYNKFPEQARFYGSTIKWLGFKQSSVSADHGTRFSGRPAYTFKSRFKLASDVILTFSDKPLVISIKVGFIMSIASLSIFIWVVTAKLIWGYQILGWASLIASIFLSTGIIVFVLGILGIYIGRIFNEVKDRPLYVIDECLNLNENYKE